MKMEKDAEISAKYKDWKWLKKNTYLYITKSDSNPSIKTNARQTQQNPTSDQTAKNRK